MSYLRLQLKGTEAEVLSDIAKIKLNDTPVYPNYPQGYEAFPSGKRCVVTAPVQEVVAPAEYDAQGHEASPAQLGDHVSHVVLSPGFDTSELQHIVSSGGGE